MVASVCITISIGRDSILTLSRGTGDALKFYGLALDYHTHTYMGQEGSMGGIE